MKKKIMLLAISVIIILLAYSFFTFPNKEKIKNNLINKYSESVTPDKKNFDSLVKIELNQNQSILLNETKTAKIYNNLLPLFYHKFELNETEKILKIICDSTNYKWGEIGTPFYDETIILFDKNENEIGYIDISLDGQINMFPNLAITKWGLLTDKGFKELVIATRTE